MRWVKKVENPFYVKTFAILPIGINGEWRWLETVYYHQVGDEVDEFTGKQFYKKDRFITKEEYEKNKYEKY